MKITRRGVLLGVLAASGGTLAYQRFPWEAALRSDMEDLLFRLLRVVAERPTCAPRRASETSRRKSCWTRCSRICCRKRRAVRSTSWPRRCARRRGDSSRAAT